MRIKQIIVRYQNPETITVFSPFSCGVDEGSIVQTVSLLFFFCSFYFINTLQSDNACNKVYLHDHKYIWALCKAYFNPRLGSLPEMSQNQAQKNIYAREHKLYCFLFKFKSESTARGPREPPTLKSDDIKQCRRPVKRTQEDQLCMNVIASS